MTSLMLTRASDKGSNPITTIASEPSDSDAAHWFKVEERNGVHWTEQGLKHFRMQNPKTKISGLLTFTIS
jgi:hypothetical protein